MPWTNVAKPTGTNWTNVAKPTGTNWTNVAKPNPSSKTIRAGMKLGLMQLPLTVSRPITIGNRSWIKVAKPT